MARHQRSIALALAAGLVGTGCALVLDPDRIDGVYRCEWDDDCPVPADPRFELVCRVSEEHGSTPDFPKVCAPQPYVSCDPAEYDYYSEFRTRFRDAMGVTDRYAEKCMDAVSVAGCPPLDGGCAEGLVKSAESGRCDDTDDATPHAISPVPQVAGQDVLDQYCRSIFCDQAYVCDKEDYLCVPCTLGESLGSGGCGDLYIDGQRSTVYETPEELTAGCIDGDFQSVEEAARLGPLQ